MLYLLHAIQALKVPPCQNVNQKQLTVLLTIRFQLFQNDY